MNPDCLICKIVRREIPAQIVYEDDETLAFLESHLLELPAITFSYATEQLPTRTKMRLKKIRLAHRRTD